MAEVLGSGACLRENMAAGLLFLLLLCCCLAFAFAVALLLLLRPFSRLREKVPRRGG
ncbi:hypothetical protein [Stenotrophomonas sp.]|uniref:hypothetical protein n=1 Tax=Stenotrophomonas sp. TaxID=69392 RepID=UPI0028A5E195|nr:hypothetical protein [Stenotrophomonas sp.]